MAYWMGFDGIWWDIMGFDDMILVGGLGHYFYFSNFCWECHHPNWLSYLFRGLKAPIRWDLLGLKKNMWLKDIHSDWVCGWMKYIYSDLVDLNGDRRIWIWMDENQSQIPCLDFHLDYDVCVMLYLQLDGCVNPSNKDWREPSCTQCHARMSQKTWLIHIMIINLEGFNLDILYIL